MIIWLAEKNSDSIEGRGHMIPIAYFLREVDARQAAQGQGPMGRSDGNVKPILVFKTHESYLRESNGELRRKALEKLTHEECLLLGLEKGSV